MPNLLSLYTARTILDSGLMVAVIVIGITVRVAVMAQPKFQPYWRQLFFETRHPQKKSN